MLEENNENMNIEIENNVDIPPEKPAPKPLHWGKRLALFLTGCLGFEVIAIIVSVVVALLITGYEPTDPHVTGVINFTCYAILIVALLGILNIDIPKLFKSFKNWKSYVFGLVFAVALVVIPIIYDTIINLFYETETSQNEGGLRQIIAIYPFLSIFIFGIVGPLCEELTYRVGAFGLLKKYKWLAYIVSSLIFALMHFDFTAKGNVMINELINLPIYIFSGVTFALAYDKFGLACSLTAHIANNLYAVTMSILQNLLK